MIYWSSFVKSEHDVFHVSTTVGFEVEEVFIETNLFLVMFENKIYIALGEVETHYLVDSDFDTIIAYYIMSVGR